MPRTDGVVLPADGERLLTIMRPDWDIVAGGSLRGGGEDPVIQGTASGLFRLLCELESYEVAALLLFAINAKKDEQGKPCLDGWSRSWLMAMGWSESTAKKAVSTLYAKGYIEGQQESNKRTGHWQGTRAWLSSKAAGVLGSQTRRGFIRGNQEEAGEPAQSAGASRTSGAIDPVDKSGSPLGGRYTNGDAIETAGAPSGDAFPQVSAAGYEVNQRVVHRPHRSPDFNQEDFLAHIHRVLALTRLDLADFIVLPSVRAAAAANEETLIGMTARFLMDDPTNNVVKTARWLDLVSSGHTVTRGESATALARHLIEVFSVDEADLEALMAPWWEFCSHRRVHMKSQASIERRAASWVSAVLSAASVSTAVKSFPGWFGKQFSRPDNEPLVDFPPDAYVAVIRLLVETATGRPQVTEDEGTRTQGAHRLGDQAVTVPPMSQTSPLPEEDLLHRETEVAALYADDDERRAMLEWAVTVNVGAPAPDLNMLLKNRNFGDAYLRTVLKSSQTA